MAKPVYLSEGRLVTDDGTEVPYYTAEQVEAAVSSALTELAQLESSADITVDTTTTPDVALLRRRSTRLDGAAPVHTTTTETSLINPAVWTTEAGRFTIDSRMLLRAVGQYTNNSGVDRNVTFALQAEGADVCAWTFSTVGTDTDARTWIADLQVAFVDLSGIRPTGQGIVSLGPAGAGSNHTTGLLVAASLAAIVDLDAEIDWRLTVEHSASASTISAVLSGDCYIEEQMSVLNA